MILNTIAPSVGEKVSSLELLVQAGFPIVTSGRETIISVRPVTEAEQTSWGEVIHLRHHPGRHLSVFANSVNEALDVLAYEFHLWEVRESFRVAKQAKAKEVAPMAK
jgi:hypothetical protein